MNRLGLKLGVLLLLSAVVGCGSGGAAGAAPVAGMERCEMCGKDVAQGELKMKADNKVCTECFDKQS